MDIEEEAKKFGGNPLLRYAPILVGLIIAVCASGLHTWKRTALEEARGNVMSVEFKIQKLKEKRGDTEDDKKEERYTKQIEELGEKDLPDAQKKVAAEQVDAANGAWLIGMARWAGLSLLSLGFVAIAAVGSNHERIGALIGLAFVVAQMR